MSDVSMAVEQDAIAESLLGEPQEATVEQTGTEQQDFQEPTQAEAQPEVEQQQEQTDDWLPTEQEKVFPDDVLSRYAQRYGLDEQSLANPQIRQLVHDKINSDIYLQQQQQQYEQQQEYQEPEPEPQPEPTQQQPQITRDQYFQNLDRAIQQRTDPEVAKSFHADFLRAFGVPEAEIAKAPPQQAMQFTQTASKYMLNLVNTFLGDMLQSQLGTQLNQNFPGFGEMYERSAYAMAWDRVRNSTPQYATLPAYGSKDFSAKLREAAQQIPGFDEMQFTDRNGQPLPTMENAMRKYGMLAQIASGQNVNPELLQRAAQAGARNANRAAVRRAAGNLGSGQSKAASPAPGSTKFQTNQDIFDDATMQMWQREHGRI